MISFRKDFACWWPDYDHKPEACFKKVMSRIRDMDYALGLCKDFKACIQAGGHAGHWAKRLSGRFEEVFTFEPERELYDCLIKNTVTISNINPRPYALGAFVGSVKLIPHPSAGSWRVGPNGIVPVPQITIDSLNLNHCGAIFLDIEGYEVEALKGAADTIKRLSPVLHLELLPRSREDIEAHVASLGYKLRKMIHNDAVFTR